MSPENDNRVGKLISCRTLQTKIARLIKS